jgi:hypothetical protein
MILLVGEIWIVKQGRKPSVGSYAPELDFYLDTPTRRQQTNQGRNGMSCIYYCFGSSNTLDTGRPR